MKKLTILTTTFLLFTQLVYAEKPNEAKDKVDETKQELYKLDKGTFISSIKLVGTVEAKKQIYLAPPFSGKLEKLKDEGSTVKKGDLVGQLENKEQQDQLSEIELEIGANKNELIVLEKNIKAELIKLDANISLAKKEVELKELELKKVLAEPTVEEMKKLKLSVDIAKKQLELAKEELKQKEKLFTKGIFKTKDILDQKLNISKKEKDYKIAYAQYIITKGGAIETSKEILRLELKKAKSLLETEIKTKDFRTSQIKMEQEKINAKIAIFDVRLNQIKKQLADSIIKAPVAGTIVLSKTWGPKGLEKAKVGDTVRRGRPFVSIASLDDLIIKTELGEQFINKAKLGLTCNITSSTMKNKVFKGKVSRIGILAGEKTITNFDNLNDKTKVFELDINMLGKNSSFNPGMSVDIEIVLKSLNNQLLINNNAVYKDKDKNFVMLPTGQRKYIQLGDSNNKQSVVLQGLTQGESVVIEKEDDGNL